jgi:rubrerythrin
MYIDSGKLIIFKQSQNLEVVKTPEKFTERELTRAIRDAIIAEEGAIKQYESVVDATDNEDVKKVLQDIADEEKIHVGELQTLLNKLLPDEQEYLDDGEKEVDDIE